MFILLFLFIAIAFSQFEDRISFKQPLNPEKIVLNYDMQGNPIVNTNYVQLTKKGRQNSACMNGKHPLTLNDFELQLKFDCNIYSGKMGGGIVLWMTEQRLQRGTFFGVRPEFTGIGIFVQFEKQNVPLISVVKNDGKNMLGQDMNKYPHCTIPGVDRSANGAVLRVIYYRSERKLKVEMMINHINQNCVEVNDIDIPTFYMGVSASNGNSINDYRVQSLYYLPMGDQPMEVPLQQNNQEQNTQQQNNQENVDANQNQNQHENQHDLSPDEFAKLQEHKKERIKEELFYIYNAIKPVKNGLNDLAQVKRDDTLHYLFDDIVVDEDNLAKQKLYSIINEMELSAVSKDMNNVKNELTKVGNIFKGLQNVSNTLPMLLILLFLFVIVFFAYKVSHVKKSNHVD